MKSPLSFLLENTPWFRHEIKRVVAIEKVRELAELIKVKVVEALLFGRTNDEIVEHGSLWIQNYLWKIYNAMAPVTQKNRGFSANHYFEWLYGKPFGSIASFLNSEIERFKKDKSHPGRVCWIETQEDFELAESMLVSFYRELSSLMLKNDLRRDDIESLVRRHFGIEAPDPKIGGRSAEIKNRDLMAQDGSEKTMIFEEAAKLDDHEIVAMYHKSKNENWRIFLQEKYADLPGFVAGKMSREDSDLMNPGVISVEKLAALGVRGLEDATMSYRADETASFRTFAISKIHSRIYDDADHWFRLKDFFHRGRV